MTDKDRHETEPKQDVETKPRQDMKNHILRRLEIRLVSVHTSRVHGP